jgi:hypothetical protein
MERVKENEYVQRTSSKNRTMKPVENILSSEEEDEGE